MTRTKKVRIANPAKLKKLRNSALLVSLTKAAGAANPNVKRKKMNKTKKKGKKNPVVGAASPVKKSARKNPIVTATKRRRHAKRNPTLFGRNLNTVETLKVFGGGLVGVTITKLVPAYLPIPELNSNPTMRVLVSGATAFLAGYFASKANPDFGSAVLFGGGMQTLSVALNAFLPGVGSQIGLRGVRRNGVGQVVALPNPPVAPENPFRPRLAPAAVMPAKAGVSGVYSSPY